MRIALIGYGKMGKAIERIALKKGHEILLKIDLDNGHELTDENLSKADVAIEFTGPASARQNLLKCAKAGIPVVCGSTGWLESYPEIREAFEKNDSAFIYASNFSIGVNIFFELNKKLAGLMACRIRNMRWKCVRYTILKKKMRPAEQRSRLQNRYKLLSPALPNG